LTGYLQGKDEHGLELGWDYEGQSANCSSHESFQRRIVQATNDYTGE
jgi:hypothetical protein